MPPMTPAFGSFAGAFSGEILLDLVGEAGDGKGLQPDSAGSGEGGEKDAVAAEDHVSDAGDALNLKGDGGLKGADVAGVDAKEFARGEVFDDEFAGELEPSDSLAGDFLQEEAVAAEDARAERLLESDAEFDAGGGAEEAVAVDEVFVAGATSTGTMWPGTRVAKATSPGPPMARYSVMKREPPPATRLMAPKKPPPPACWVWVVICTEADIQESSPASEITASFWPRANSRTGIVVPRDAILHELSFMRRIKYIRPRDLQV